MFQRGHDVGWALLVVAGCLLLRVLGIALLAATVWCCLHLGLQRVFFGG